MGVISPQLETAHRILTNHYQKNVDYKDLGAQVLWVWRNGVLVKRTIAGTSTLSQHVGGNAWDVGPMSGSSQHLAVIDSMVQRARLLGCRVLWRGVRNHFPHHAHIEGVPKYSQAELAGFYDTEDEDMEVKALVEGLQRGMVEAGYDLGDFGPNDDGVDGDWGPATQAAWRQVCEDAKFPQQVLPNPDQFAKADHQHGVDWPPMTDIVTGTPI